LQVVAAAGAADVYLLQLALILAGSWRLVGKVFRVLLEGTPAHLDMRRLCSELGTRRRRLQQIAYKDFGIAHITIQIEQSLEGCTERHHFDHLLAPETRREFEYPGQGQA
jgi:Co/Zn/Cd efflux system component